MNKAYKVVFNKVRGTMMVVNEVTSSIQKKGTKTVLSAALIGGLSVCGASPVWADTTLSGPHVIENTSESQSSYLDSAHHWIGGALTLEDGSDVTIKSNGNGLINVSGSKASLTLSAVNTGDTNGIYMNGLNGSVGEANFVLDKLNVGNAYTGSQLIIGIGIYVTGDNSVNISAKDLTINSAGDGVQVTPSQDSVKGLNVTGLDNLEINAGQGSAKDGMAVTMTYGRVSFESKEGSQGTFLFQSNEDNRYETHGVINNRGSGTLIVKNDAGTNQIIGPNMTGVYLNYREVGLEGGTLSVSGAQNIIQASAAVRADMPEGKLFLTATTGDNTIIGSNSGIAVIEGAAQVKAENGCNVITAAENKGVALQAGGNHLSKIASRQPGSGTLTVIGKTNIINGRVLAETSGSQIDIFGDTSVVYDHAAVNDEANAAVDARNGGRIGLGQGSDRVLVQNLGSLDRDGEKVNIGILARLSPSVVDVKGNELTVSVNAKGNDWAYGVHAQNNSTVLTGPFATINLDSAKTVINVSAETVGNGQAISAMSQGVVNVTGDLEINTAYDIPTTAAITARGNAAVNINTERNRTVKMKGAILFDYDARTSGTGINAKVNVNLSDADSYWIGSAQKSGNPPLELSNVDGFKLGLSNGGSWMVTGNSFVNTLTLMDGGRIQQAEGATVAALDVSSLTISGNNNSIALPNATATFNQMTVDGALNLDVATLKGSIGVNDGGRLAVGTITNTGDLTVKAGGNLTIGTKITNDGNLTLESNSTVTALLSGVDLSSGTVTVIDGTGTLDNKSELSKNGIYDICWVLDDNGVKTGNINVKTKSAEQIVSDINVSEQQAGTVAAILPTIIGSGSAPASTPIAQIASALGTALELQDSQTVAQIAEDLAPSTAPVVSSVSQGVNNAIAGVANARMAANRAAGDVFTGGSAWAQMIYNSADQDATKRTAKLESDTYGVTVGIDGKIGDNLTIGAGFGVTKTDAESGTRDIDVDSYALFGYTEYNADNGWFVNGMVNAIRGRYEENKTPAGIKLTAKYQTTVLGAGVATGYHFENGISPEVGLRYLRTHQGSYNDGAQKIHTDGTNLLTASIGAKYEQAFEQGDWVLKPSARVAATYDVVSDDTESAIRVIGGGQYHVISAHQKRAAYEAGIGLEASNGDWDFSVSYNGEFRSHFQSHTGMLKAKYNF